LLSSAEKNTPSRQFEKERLFAGAREELSDREKRFAKENPGRPVEGMSRD
jgi:hypothetical protein